MIHWMKSAVEQIVHLEKSRSAMIASTSFILARGVQGVEKGQVWFQIVQYDNKNIDSRQEIFLKFVWFYCPLKTHFLLPLRVYNVQLFVFPWYKNAQFVKHNVFG